jgi:hypothetical protein
MIIYIYIHIYIYNRAEEHRQGSSIHQIRVEGENQTTKYQVGGLLKRSIIS